MIDWILDIPDRLREGIDRIENWGHGCFFFWKVRGTGIRNWECGMERNNKIKPPR